MLGQPHRFEAEFLGTDREVRHRPGCTPPGGFRSYSADVTAAGGFGSAAIAGESVILHGRPSSVWPMTASRLTVRYAAALALSQLLAAVELTVPQDSDAQRVWSPMLLVCSAGTFVAATVPRRRQRRCVIGYAVVVVNRKLRWFTA